MSPAAPFIYPGQGAQHIGMGQELISTWPSADRYFETARQILGYSLKTLCCHGPDEEINRDLNAQLGVYTISCIITDILKRHGVRPNAATGYSSGFYAAAYAAGCFDFEVGLTIVRKAGEILLHTGCRFEGAMGVVFGLSSQSVAEMCRCIRSVDIAILNTPKQIVVSGLRRSVECLLDTAMHRGALDTFLLPTATAYHSPLLYECADRLVQALSVLDIRRPALPLYAYDTLQPVDDQRPLIQTIADQVYRPVLWVDLIKKLGHNRSITMIEVGPGTVLSRGIRWTDRHIRVLNTASPDRIKTVIRSLGSGTKPAKDMAVRINTS